jgi:acyl carrier protein
MNVEEAVNWLAQIFEEPAGRMKPDTPRDRIAGWDSLGTLSLIACLDERFDIHLPEEEIEGFKNVSDVLAILRRHGHLDGE